MEPQGPYFLDEISTMNTNNRWYMSSDGSGKKSITLIGAVAGIVPLILFVAEYFHIPLTETEVVEFVQQVTALAAILTTLYGLLKKLYHKLTGTGKYAPRIN